MAFWLGCAALPFVAGLHRYSVVYGYKGVSKQQAWRDSKFAVFGTAVFLVLPVVVVHLFTNAP